MWLFEIEEGNLSTEIHPRSERPLHGPLQTFDVEAEVAHLREEKSGGRGDATPSPYEREGDSA